MSRRWHRAVAAVLVVLGALSFGPAARADERGASMYLEKVRGKSALLSRFLLAMPKGGDLHMHLSGSVYAEVMLKFGAEANDCVNVSTLVATLPPCTVGQRPIADAQHDGKLRDQIIDAWSMRNYTGPNGHDHFFDTFAKFSVTLNGRAGDALASVAQRAFSQNELYIEPLITPRSADVAAIADKVQYTRDFALLRERLLHAGLGDVVPKAIADTNDIFAQKRRADPNPFPVIRLDVQVGRAAPPVLVFTRLLFAFELMRADRRWVGVNLVQPEADPISLRDYTLQMEMLHYLRRVYPVGHITLHAGELVPGLVPLADLRFHIRQAVADRRCGANRPWRRHRVGAQPRAVARRDGAKPHRHRDQPDVQSSDTWDRRPRATRPLPRP